MFSASFRHGITTETSGASACSGECTDAAMLGWAIVLMAGTVAVAVGEDADGSLFITLGDAESNGTAAQRSEMLARYAHMPRL
jgi:hypothetical protein